MLAISYKTWNNEIWKNTGAMYTQTVEDLKRNGFDFGLKNYPIWNESKRDYLNNLIINHYSMYEIGYETEGYWKRMLNNKMEEIMPYYNRIMEAIDLQYDPLIDHDETQTHNETGTNDVTGTMQAGENHTDTDLYSDTPQNDISNMVSGTPEQVITHYLTTAGQKYGNSAQHQTDTTDQDTTKNYTHHATGRHNSGQSLALEYMETARRVYTDILNELKPLFMGLYR